MGLLNAATFRNRHCVDLYWTSEILGHDMKLSVDDIAYNVLQETFILEINVSSYRLILAAMLSDFSQ